MLYACDAKGSPRDLSRKAFAASPALYLAGGDFFARQLLVDAKADAARFHLIDAPKSAVSAMMPPVGERGEDGGEVLHRMQMQEPSPSILRRSPARTTDSLLCSYLELVLNSACET